MKKITHYILFLLALMVPLLSIGQAFPLPMTGFNEDVVANGVGAASTSTTNDVDGVSFAFKSLDWKLNATSAAQSKGFPLDGVIHSISTAGLYFKLQPYTQNNSIRISTTSTSITSNITSAYSASKIYILLTSGSGGSTLGGTITFTDNTTQAFSGIAIPDWYGTTGLSQAYINFGRINVSNNSVEDGTSTSQPRLFQAPIDILVGNQTKVIQSITFTKTAGSGIVNIFGVSAEAVETCTTPYPITINGISATSANFTWSVPAVVPQNGYQYEVRTSGLPGSGATGLVATNTVTGLTASATGLQPITLYHLYIRSLCTSGSGVWKWGGSFTTLCGAVSTNFFEGFETTATGSSSNNNYPTCWSYIDGVSSTNGYGYVSTSAKNNGSNGYYTYRSGTSGTAYEGNLMLVSPETVNLGNGTKQIRFWAKVSSSTYSTTQKFELYTMNGNSATSTRTLLQGNFPLTTTWQEFTIPVPATTDDYFAFSFERVGGTSYVYLDDINYEDLSPCAAPTNVLTSLITQTTAKISWNLSLATGVTGYEYEVRTSGAAGSGATGLALTGTTSATTNFVDLTGLSVGTNYTVYVRSVCGTSNGDWTQLPFNFNTLCGIVDYISEGFESTATGSSTNNTYPLCWSYVDTVASSGYGYVSTTAKNTGNNGFYTYRTSTTGTSYDGDILLISPETNNLGNGGKRLRFWAKVSSSTYATTHKFEVYTMDGTTATSTKTLLMGSIPLSTTWQEFVVNIPVTTNDYFAFSFERSGGTSTVYLDDVVYEDIPAPTLDASSTNNVCPGGMIGTASVTVTDGAAPLTYLWSNGSTTPNISGLASGTYTITVTDAINRSVSATVTITEPDAINSNATVTNITCNGLNNGSITLATTGGTSPYSYSWSNGATTDALTNLPAGTYSVSVTDANLCVKNETFTITEPTVLVATSTSKTDVTWYGGNDGSATVTASGGTSPYTYLWSNGETTATAISLVAGSPTVTVTDANGCTATASFVIEQPIPLMIDSVSQTNVKCNGATDGTATVVAIGGNAPYTYLWAPSGGTAATATGLAAGTYTVEVKDITNNIISQSFTITQPDAIVVSVSGKTDVKCNGGANGTATIAVNGGTAPFTYVWSHGVTTTNPTLSNLVAGTYDVTITDYYGCTSTTPANVVITQPTVLAVSSSSSTDIICYGQNNGTATVTVTGGTEPYSYIWSNGQSGPSVSNLTKGTYVVTIADANNCSVTQSFTIAEPAYVLAPTAANQSFCVGQNATLADIVISGSNIKWYSAVTGGVMLPATTVLTNATTYYATQTVGVCESSIRTAVQITLNQGTPLTTTQLSVCSNTRIQNVTLNGFNYTQLKWYSSATSTTQLASSLLLGTGTYYVSTVTGACESARQAIQVTVAAVVPAPVAAAQTVCSLATLNDLVVQKDPSASLNWYSSSTSMVPLNPTMQVVTGTYYVQQVLGNCESVKVPVSVQVVNAAQPTMTSLTVCEGKTIADLNTANDTYVWYVDNTTATPLPNTFVITSGSYYIARESMGCISARTNVAVNVGAVPSSPTGQATQYFPFPAKVSDLLMNQPGVKWYSTINDAVAMVNELLGSTFLMDGVTYYGILVSPNNCGSAPTAVKVMINLSNAELDLAQLKYYPNPVDSELNITYTEEIKRVEVFTLTGQRVMSNEYNSNEVKTDLSRLSAGTYLVKVETAKASQFIKVVKR
ncbi:T9SS type A sorting domain-containing protein [Myroides sp. JBRI-B21084]|uniref:T9SS type A sorting domain-containing protein n=1 Tax=Myroides sp. JBRI-B21084 TaxID=3119977 RepID=UPI0026E34595|nr:T9SS type A sorting domain-containing protein [Paenimyroides cloacae]WKW46939.1 T9SS type A sorting domain-containing protein [Paenimyroides cloacae]